MIKKTKRKKTKINKKSKFYWDHEDDLPEDEKSKHDSALLGTYKLTSIKRKQEIE